MDSLQWLAQITDDAAPTTAARRAGVQVSTMSRQVAKGVLSPETVVAIARAYHAPVLPGLVACGLITADEARVIAPMGTLLTDATDEALLDEVLRRIRAGHDQHPTLTEPLDHVPDPEDTYEPEPEPEPEPGPDTEPADAYQDDYATAAAQYDTPTDWDDASMMDDGA